MESQVCAQESGVKPNHTWVPLADGDLGVPGLLPNKASSTKLSFATVLYLCKKLRETRSSLRM
jgi:hypothetical protein